MKGPDLLIFQERPFVPPGDKFSATMFDPEKHLYRDLAGFGFPSTDGVFTRFTFLEGQAGQGKTTLAAQLLYQRRVDFCWYRMEEADRSAAYFLGSLLTGLKTAMPSFATPADASIQSGKIAREQAPKLLAAILAAFGHRLETEFFLILDDVHHCLPASEALPLLHALIDQSPSLLHLVFLARRNLAPLVETAQRRGSTICLDSRALAFSASEIADLFNSLLQVPLTRRAVHSLRQITDGWIMGLQLTGRCLHSDEPEKIEKELEALQQKRDVIFDYLLGQVLADLTPERHESLLILSLLEEIPLDLARMMTGCETIGAVLDELARENCFICSLDDKKSVFVLHHLFQEGLRQLAQREKGPEEIRRLYGLAADWYLQGQQPDRAIHYYLDAEDFLQAEAALRQAGLHFKAQHKLTALRREIGELPGEVVAAHPWFAYYCGLGLMTEDPLKALQPLQLAHEQFVRRGDDLGELLAGTQLMLFSVAIDGNYARGYPLLDRTMALLDAFAESLPPLVLGYVANIALLANTFLDFNPRQAERFFNLGLDIALRENLVSLELDARVTRLYYLTFSGAWQRCRQELEVALPLLYNPLSSQLHRGAMFLAYMGFLKGSGDFDAYERQKKLYRTQFTASLRESSIGEAYILFWDLQMHLALGDRGSAEAILRVASVASGAAAGPHLKNLFLQYAALLAAEAGRKDEALTAMETARELRKKAGGLYFNDMNDAFYGATFDLLDEDGQALASFDRALQSPSTYLRETALAFRARFYHRRGNAKAQDDLRELLGKMREGEHGQCYGWMPERMGDLLSFAVKEGIEQAFARQLAAQRLACAVLDDGTLLPLLEITTLGALQFRIGEQVVLSDADLGESQRQILAVLLAHPEPSYPQKRLQLLLWPESSEIKSRNNFDKLLSRLRKSFHAAFGPNARHYLQLKNGILSLCHCRIDASDFMRMVRQGSKHFRQGELWQAENLLHKATGLYKGEFLPSASESDLIGTYRSDLLRVYQSGTLVHAEALLKLHQPHPAIAILEQSLLADSLHDETIKKLYSLLILHDNPSRAQMVVKRYGEALRREGYQPREIRETLEGFWD